VHFMANSRPADGVRPEQLHEYLEANDVSSNAWEFVRNSTVTEYAFKVGELPGVVLFLRADSEDEARQLVDSIPVVEQGLLRFELEPLGIVVHL
jgi:hypothetical protein